MTVSAPDSFLQAAAPPPKLTRSGIRVNGEVLPLLCGSMHYFRHSPESWRPALESLRALGCRLVDTYVPWGVHELEPGVYDFGQLDPRKNVRRFLDIAQDVGLLALVRPGPHINAELTYFGIPERVVHDADCQARSPRGKPVLLPMPPSAFAVPSCVSRTFLRLASRWLTDVASELAPCCHPHGPIVFCQVDNEGALYFRDGVYDQDYHPDGVARFREQLATHYGSVGQLNAAYGSHYSDFSEVIPPARYEAEEPLARHLDWAEHQEASIADSFTIFRDALHRGGFAQLPMCHNLPMGETGTPLDPARIGRVVECLGLDYYHAARGSADLILRRTSEVVSRADAFDYPAFASELAAGFPPFFAPLTKGDNAFAALSCVAAGVRGLNLYMAVDRDRWLGAPIDRQGRMRSSADFWRSLLTAIERTKLHELERAADVAVLIPRSIARLSRVMHAFGPLSAAAFDIMGLDAAGSCFEDGPHGARLLESEQFIDRLLAELLRRGVPCAIAGNDAATHVMARARLTFMAVGFGLEPELWSVASAALGAGRALYFGPELPENTPNGLSPLPPSDLAKGRVLGLEGLPQALDQLLTEHSPLQLGAGPALRLSLFRDRSQTPRVLFVTNPTSEAHTAELGHLLGEGKPLLGATRAVDALDGEVFHARFRALEIPLLPFSVRMLELG